MTIRRGVSLVEVVVALGLASLLIWALCGVLVQLTLQRKREAEVIPATSQYVLDRLLWIDLSQASTVALDRGVLWIVTHQETTPTSLGQSRSRVAVTYRLESLRKPNDFGSSITPSYSLIRALYPGERPSGKPILEQNVLWNVQKIGFQRIDDFGNRQPLPQLPGPTPRAFEYELLLEGQSNPVRKTVVVR